MGICVSLPKRPNRKEFELVPSVDSSSIDKVRSQASSKGNVSDIGTSNKSRKTQRSDNISSIFSSSNSNDNNSPQRQYFFNRPPRTTFGIVVIGYLRLYFQSSSFSLCISELIIKYYGAIHGNIIVKENEIKRLKCSFGCNRFEFDSILIKKRGILTTNSWNDYYQCGGSLHIICLGNIIIEEEGSINLNGKGYSGGLHGRSGESYRGLSSYSSSPNHGGGGGAGLPPITDVQSNSNRTGGGGGYGSYGNDGENNNGSGGEIYGNKYLNILHLGSGGGGSTKCGGSGGGALKIECGGNICLKSKSKICCNGTNGGYKHGSGTGSGGSIHIILNKLNNLNMNKYSIIQSIGGYSPRQIYGEGGDGRIRISFKYNNNNNNNKIDKKLSRKNIVPQPYIG